MTDNERLEFLIGQVAACKSALMTLVECAEFPDHLLRELREDMETMTAKTLASSATDPILAGIEDVKIALEFVATEAIRRQGLQDN